MARRRPLTPLCPRFHGTVKGLVRVPWCCDPPSKELTSSPDVLRSTRPRRAPGSPGDADRWAGETVAPARLADLTGCYASLGLPPESEICHGASAIWERSSLIRRSSCGIMRSLGLIEFRGGLCRCLSASPWQIRERKKPCPSSSTLGTSMVFRWAQPRGAGPYEGRTRICRQLT